MTVFPSARILLFAKAPVPGQVKTRLIPALGAEGAARLHAVLLARTLALLDEADLAPLELHCAPDVDDPRLRALADKYGVRCLPQCDGDLGARLLTGSADALMRADAAVLIGCDCPELDAAYLQRALQALADRRTDAVLGPAADGGYVLLGLRRAAPELFMDMPWGTDRVADATRARMAALGWRWTELPVLRDLDRPEDLAWYRTLCDSVP